jgi:peptide/nickel transport system substrate-binding protein
MRPDHDGRAIVHHPQRSVSHGLSMCPKIPWFRATRFTGLLFLPLAAVLLAGLLLPLFAGPSFGASSSTAAAKPAGNPQYGGTFRIVDTPPGSPFGVPWEIIGVSICSAIPALEPLVRMDRAGNLVPCLAESWKIAKDRKSVTFAIRKGVKFHDGTDMNAEAVRFNLQSEIDAKVGGAMTWATVEVVDDYTVKLNLKEYDNRMFVSLAGTVGAIISPTALKKIGIEKARWQPVGTGPFEFVSYERDVAVKYKKFKDYWDKGKPYLDAIEIRMMRDPQTMKAALLAGEIDAFGENGGELVAEMKSKGFKTFSADNGIVMLFPDSVNQDSPFANKAVREALSMAIDRESLAKARGFGTWQAATQAAYPEQPAFLKNVHAPGFDPAKAKQLLAKAGYANGFKTKLIAMPMVVDRDAAVAIQRFLADVGIDAEVEIPEMSRYRQYQTKGWRGLVMQPWGFFASYNQLIGFYFYGAEGFVSVKRPQGLEELFKESTATVTPDVKKMQKLNRLIADDLTVIPTYSHSRDYMVGQNVHDTGHMKWASWPWWTPATAWLSK